MSYCYKLSNALNRAKGTKHPHLTLCAEFWLHDRKQLVRIMNVLAFIIWLERDHCRKQYFTYGVKNGNIQPHTRTRNRLSEK